MDTTEATEENESTSKATPAAIPVDMTALDKHAEVATVLYQTELRQLLIDDLEELESFLKQR